MRRNAASRNPAAAAAAEPSPPPRWLRGRRRRRQQQQPRIASTVPLLLAVLAVSLLQLIGAAAGTAAGAAAGAGADADADADGSSAVPIRQATRGGRVPSAPSAGAAGAVVPDGAVARALAVAKDAEGSVLQVAASWLASVLDPRASPMGGATSGAHAASSPSWSSSSASLLAGDAAVGEVPASPVAPLDAGYPACFTDPSFLSLFLGVFIICGTIASYAPQYVSIIRAKSSEGLSFLMLALSLESSFLTAINSGILNWPHVTCCVELTVGQCLENVLPTIQLTVSLLCYLVLYLLFLYYCDATGPRAAERRKALIVFVGVCTSSVAAAIIAGGLYYGLGFSGTTLATLAMVLGIVSAVLMILMWAPQIVETWRKQDPGSLSVLMLLMQMPGAILVIVFQGIVNRNNWTTWVPYVFNFIQMLILVIILLFLWIKNRGKSGVTLDLVDDTSTEGSAPAAATIATGNNFKDPTEAVDAPGNARAGERVPLLAATPGSEDDDSR